MCEPVVTQKDDVCLLHFIDFSALERSHYLVFCCSNGLQLGADEGFIDCIHLSVLFLLVLHYRSFIHSSWSTLCCYILSPQRHCLHVPFFPLTRL